MLLTDAVIEVSRTILMVGLFAYVLIAGRQKTFGEIKDWHFLAIGFALFALSSIFDTINAFSGSPFGIFSPFFPPDGIIGKFFVGKSLGYIFGATLVFIGLFFRSPPHPHNDKAPLSKLPGQDKNHLQYLVELSPDAIVIHRERKIIYANPAAVKLMGGHSPGDLLGRDLFGFIHPDYIDQAKRRIDSLYDGAPYDGAHGLPAAEIRLLRLNGTSVDAEVTSGATIYMGKPAFHSVIRDITRHNRTLEALRRSERNVRTILDNMSDLFYRTDLSGRITMASASIEELTGYTLNEAIGLHLASWYADPLGRDKLLKTLEEKGGRVKNYEALMRRKDGREFWVSINAHFIYEDAQSPSGVEGSLRDITELVEARNRLEHMAMQDELTGTANRRQFETFLEQAMARSNRSNVPGALLYFDLDDFKSINDTYGHEFGDWVLQETARRITKTARGTDLLARMGGDEFCLILENIHDVDGAVKVANNIIGAMGPPFERDGVELVVCISIGLAIFSGRDDNVSTPLRKADIAMYKSKQEPGSRFQVAEP